jgi:leucyl-tRNA synthetase
MVNFQQIEKKWQDKWEESRIFQVKENPKKDKYYILEMYPYPSSSGLHIGHAFNYTIGDIYARFKRMQGFNVLYPMGYDSFGLPAENAAIKANSNPRLFTDEAIKNFIKQQKCLGLSYDWSRKIQSHDENYYKWNQYFFIKFFENGLVYRKESPVNWCSECNTVLANEQVHNGKCWRHRENYIEVKNLNQWFIKTTKYAEELLHEVDQLNWPERIKIMQKNWIGKSYGTEINFKINNEVWKVFTTRPDTIYGVTFMVVSAQHPKLNELITKDQKKQVEEFLKKIKSTSEKDILEKEGVFTGSYATNPVNNEKIPVWIGNFVVADYGCGMVMSVPAHDQRDFEFAKKYNLQIKTVIQPEDKKFITLNKAYTEEGILINSNKFNGLNNKEAINKIIEFLEKKKIGEKSINYKLKDWLVSRQRYWGTPIPMVYCEKCGIVPINENDLPVKLPENVKFGKGNPLETNVEFIITKCPKCNSKAKRETDTMDTFFDSSWYYLRFTDPTNNKKPFDKKNTDYWMPVDFYVGGAEHACMHLIYARFFSKALRDIKLISYNEPFKRLFNQGMIHGEDGFVMSKSRGNVIDPLKISQDYSADALRFFLVSVASPDKDLNWSQTGLESSFRTLNKIHNYIETYKEGKTSERTLSKLHKTIKQITEEVELQKYNISVIKIRELFESFENEINKKDLEIAIKLISPFCPHLSEELWSQLGNKTFISSESWPIADETKINEELEKQDQQIETTLTDIRNILKIIKEKENKDASKVYLYIIPKELELYKTNKERIEKNLNLKLEVYANNDSKKYDPKNKAPKAKLGKPALYIE